MNDWNGLASPEKDHYWLFRSVVESGSSPWPFRLSILHPRLLNSILNTSDIETPKPLILIVTDSWHGIDFVFSFCSSDSDEDSAASSRSLPIPSLLSFVEQHDVTQWCLTDAICVSRLSPLDMHVDPHSSFLSPDTWYSAIHLSFLFFSDEKIGRSRFDRYS